MKNKIKLLFLIILIQTIIFPSIPASATDNGFDPNFIISDSEILDSASMSLEDIKQFLTDKGGYLGGYSCANPDGKIMTAAVIIYDRAVTNKVNPKFIIVLLQKEMGLI